MLLRRTSEVLAQFENLERNDSTLSASESGPIAPENVRYTGNTAAGSTDGAYAPSVGHQTLNESDLALESAENPLQLLANASDHLRVGRALGTFAGASPTFDASCTLTLEMTASDEKKIEDFFGPVRPRLDTAKELDPIELGLVTISDAETLFS